MLLVPSGEITLQEKPNIDQRKKAPVIQLAPGFTIDDMAEKKEKRDDKGSGSMVVYMEKFPSLTAKKRR